MTVHLAVYKTRREVRKAAGATLVVRCEHDIQTKLQ